jgi:hypothetical protein
MHKMIRNFKTLMTKSINLTVACLLASLYFVSPAKAEDRPLTIKLNRIQGNVMIDAQGQYKAVTIETMVTSDTKILLQKSATAQLVYPSGCTLKLEGNKIYKAGDENNCKQGAPFLVAVNDTAAVGAVPAAAKAESENRTGAWLLGAGVLGIVGAAAAAGGSGHQQSPSPSP